MSRLNLLVSSFTFLPFATQERVPFRTRRLSVRPCPSSSTSPQTLLVVLSTNLPIAAILPSAVPSRPLVDLSRVKS